jgi:drug/metabolite transporter (DMT)-like permease
MPPDSAQACACAACVRCADVTRRPDLAVLAAFAGAVVLGSANIVAVRFSNRELDPLWGAGVRFAVASAVLCAIGAASARPFPRGRSLRGAVSFGLFAFTGAYALFYLGAVEVPAGTAGVLMALVPLLTLGLATVQGLERFSWRGLVGALLAVAGIVAIVSGSPAGGAPVASVLLIVGAATCASQAGIVVKRTPVSDVITLNGVAMAVGAVLLLAASFATGETHTAPSSPSVWAAVGFLALVGSPMLFILYVYVLNHWTASAASYQFVLFPPVTIALGAVVAGESVTGGLVLGVPLVLAGVYVGALRRGGGPDQPSSSSSPRPDGVSSE